MSYPYEQIFAGDPSAPERVAVNGVVTIFEPGDATMAPLTITTLDGLPLANPMQVNESGFGPAFQHETLDQVAWAGGGFTGVLTSYKGMKEAAVAAQQGASAAAINAEQSRLAAEDAVRNAQAPSDEAVDAALERADLPGTIQQAVSGKLDRSEASNTFGVKPDNGGKPVGKGEEVFSVKPTGGDDVANIRTALTLAAEQGGTLLFTPGHYNLNSWSVFTTQGLSTFPRYVFWVPSNVKIVGMPGAVLHENGSYDTRRVIFYLEGSNITIEGLTFQNDYDMAGGSRPTTIPIAAGDGFNGAMTTTLRNIRVNDCTFHRSWHPIKFDFSLEGGSAAIEGIIVSGCTSFGEPTSTSSGGLNFKSITPGRVRNVQVTSCQIYDVTVSAAIGYYGVMGGAITGNLARRSQIDGAGIQLENGAEDITISANVLLEHFNHIWVDDSSYVSITGNAASNPAPLGTQKGIRITRQGFTGEPNRVTTDVVVSGNILRNCYIVSEPFGPPTGSPSFGSFTISDNIVRLDGTTNSHGILLGGCIAAAVTSNRVIGASSSSITVSASLNQMLVVEGNITTKVGAEASVGFTLTNTNAYRPIVGGNQFTNGISIPQSVSTIVGNCRVFSATGTPEGVVSAPVGSLYLRDGGGVGASLYVKESGTGSTGWVAK